MSHISRSQIYPSSPPIWPMEWTQIRLAPWLRIVVLSACKRMTLIVFLTFKPLNISQCFNFEILGHFRATTMQRMRSPTASICKAFPCDFASSVSL